MNNCELPFDTVPLMNLTQRALWLISPDRRKLLIDKNPFRSLLPKCYVECGVIEDVPQMLFGDFLRTEVIHA